MVPSIANLIHVGHVLLLVFGGAVAAESLQMVFAASELAIVDVEPCLDLARLRAATWKGVLGVQTSGRLHRHYALDCRAIAAGLQRKYACSGPIVSIAEKVACLFDNPMTLSVLPKTAEHAHTDQRSNSRLDSYARGRAVCIAVLRVRIDDTMVTLRVHICLPLQSRFDPSIVIHHLVHGSAWHTLSEHIRAFALL